MADLGTNRMLVVYNEVANFRQAGKSALFAIGFFLDSSFSPLVASRQSSRGRERVSVGWRRLGKATLLTAA
jgi:hypothetical protein